MAAQEKAKIEAAHAHAAIDQRSIHTIRTLSMDAVQAANSGHPGTAMALAPVVHTLWNETLHFDPETPAWPNRDRFVLSVGHASMLLYSILHLTQVKTGQRSPGHTDVVDDLAVPLDHIKRFRQLDSRCPGHPEYHWTAGVETTTGPLGQGLANSVGMAIASKWQAEYFNRPRFEIFNYKTYALCGDGCIQEGISHEAAALAGHLRLGNLCWIYDNNKITIEGHTDLAFSEDVATRFVAYGWNVVRVVDANDQAMLRRAFATFAKTPDRPTLVIVDSRIGYGAPNKQDTHAAHGEPLGEEEIKLAKRFYGWPEDAKFLVPEDVVAHYRAGIGERGARMRAAWNELVARYNAEHPHLGEHLKRMTSGTLPDGWDKDLPTFAADDKGLASRDSSGKVLNAIAKRVPWLLGGSADLAPSTKTRLTFEGAGDFLAPDSHQGSYAGRNLHFGIREHAMHAIVNGLTLSGLRAYGSQFLIFSDYARTAIRLSALMEIPALHIFTHDSIGVGEDGPTHQPIEQLVSLRSIPGMLTIRPADANEVVEAWRLIMESKREPVSLILTRQALPTLDRSRYAHAKGLHQGGYILAGDVEERPDVLLIATGSEVSLCVQAHEQLRAQGVRSRVVSLPCFELFERQSEAYREQVLPRAVRARVCVEKGAAFGWDRYAGESGAVIAMRSFGASAPLKDLQKRFGFTAQHIADQARSQVERHRAAP
jgi:transketolase